MRHDTSVRQARPANLPPLWLSASALAAGITVAFGVVRWISHFTLDPNAQDTRVWIVPARIGLTYGWSHISDLDLERVASAALGPTGSLLDSIHLYLSPPPAAWLVIPLAWLPIPASYLIWTIVNLAAFIAICWLVFPGPRFVRLTVLLVSLAIWPVHYQFWLGQWVVADLFFLGLAWWLLERGPWPGRLHRVGHLPARGRRGAPPSGGLDRTARPTESRAAGVVARRDRGRTVHRDRAASPDALVGAALAGAARPRAAAPTPGRESTRAFPAAGAIERKAMIGALRGPLVVRRPPLWLAAAAVASGWAALYTIGRWTLLFAVDPVHEDVRLTYVAAQAGLRYGWPTIYDQAILRSLSQSFPAGQRHIDSLYTYVNPPLLAWLFAPLTAFPEPVAYGLWTLFSLGALIAAWRIAAPYTGAAKLTLLLVSIGLWPVMLAFYFGQPTMLVIALLAATWWLAAHDRPFAAGVALALATFLKPQDLALVPVVLLVSGRGRPVAGWAAA